MIRPSRDDDVDAIAAIYRHHVLHGTGTFEIDPPSELDMRGRRSEVLARGLPWLVADDAGEITGFAYCNWFKPRPAYRFSAEDSIYLAPHAQGKGLGLIVSYQFAQLMGGSLPVKNTISTGSTFTFRLPVGQATMA